MYPEIKRDPESSSGRGYELLKLEKRVVTGPIILVTEVPMGSGFSEWNFQRKGMYTGRSSDGAGVVD
jgi:hypothetical protein